MLGFDGVAADLRSAYHEAITAESCPLLPSVVDSRPEIISDSQLQQASVH